MADGPASNAIPTQTEEFEPQADFGGYKNRHLNADQLAATKIKTQAE